MASYYFGVDVGGSHLSGGLLDTQNSELIKGSYQKVPIQHNCTCNEFVETFSNLLNAVTSGSNITLQQVSAIGVAMPGPFDYENGISHIHGVEKYDALFGIDIKSEINKITGGLPLYFSNDAESFALGEYASGAALNSPKAIVLTLGTGFGSTFLEEGKLLADENKGVPANGYLYNIPYKEGIADDFFSTRWFVRQWESYNRESVTSVEAIARLAAQKDTNAITVFDAFADNFVDFMDPWVSSFKPDNIILGGGIAKAAPYFLDKITSKLNTHNPVGIKICRLWDTAAIIGAATHAKNMTEEKQTIQNTEWRKTQQFLAPEKKELTEKTGYDAYPSYPLGDNKIKSGAAALADWIVQHKTVVIDGYQGVFWNNIVESIDAELALLGKNARWFHTGAAMKPEAELDDMLAPFLGGDDPLFGKITDKSLIDWFDAEKLNKITPDEDAGINILLGPGAALAGWDAPIVYFDLPKNELQFRARAGHAKNLGVSSSIDNRRTYKRFFFVDWVVLNKHKSEILPNIDIIVDEQRPDNFLFMDGAELRKGLKGMATNVFRPRPWFEPGAWGGTWMKEHMEGINKDVDNLAWSFELMVLENGILFESDGYLLEVSFDFLMFNNYRDVLGDSAEKFKYDFPIRFDFLDTFDGGNLSIQCHPSPAYIREHFGMPFTQDETYYILDCKEEPLVYLGFQEGVQPQEFHDALVESQENVEELDVDKYIQKFTAKKHDLFLIPHGTIHASGSNNLVLEVSSAPYIFTFKMYDWLRLDLDGKPRPINIERGMDNVNFERSGERVSSELISKPYVIREDENYTIEHLPTHADHFYDVHRYNLSGKLQIETHNKCHVWMLVEGSSVEIATQNGITQTFNYAETFVIPAAANSYTVYNKDPHNKALLVKAFIK